jgi:cystine transport system substrate-binding protein
MAPGDWRKKLSVAWVTEEPWSYKDKDGTLTGFDVAIVKECAKRLGVSDISWNEIQWKDIVAGLRDRRFHMFVTGLGYREERAAVGIPSEPLYLIASTGFVQKGNPIGAHSLDDFAGKDYRVGGIFGSMEMGMLKRLIGDRAIGYSSEEELWPALDKGDVKAAAFAEMAGRRYLARHPEAKFEVAIPFNFPLLPKTMYFFPKGDETLKSAFDDSIREIKTDGTLTRILTGFGYPAEMALPAGTTVGSTVP